MGQSIPATHEVRNRKDKGGYIPNRKGKAHFPKASGRSASLAPSPTRRPQHGVEMSPHEFRPEMGEASRRYFMRCPDLGLHDWELTTGPWSIYAAVRMKLARVDHDAAFPVSLGGKKVEFEVRHENSSKVMRFLCSGWFYPKYECEKVESPAL